MRIGLWGRSISFLCVCVCVRENLLKPGTNLSFVSLGLQRIVVWFLIVVLHRISKDLFFLLPFLGALKGFPFFQVLEDCEGDRGGYHRQ